MEIRRSAWNGPTLLVWLLVVLLFAGCTFKTKLVGPYDEIVDNNINQLQSQTSSHITTIVSAQGTGAGAYDRLKAFYREVDGRLDALIVRAEVLETGLKKTPLVDNLKLLKEQYQDLEMLHQSPYNEKAMTSAEKAFAMSYRAIVKHLVYLKWNQQHPE